jgi:hypothetical protein
VAINRREPPQSFTQTQWMKLLLSRVLTQKFGESVVTLSCYTSGSRYPDAFELLGSGRPRPSPGLSGMTIELCCEPVKDVF